MFSLSNPGSFVLPASFNPPVLPAPTPSAAASVPPARVFLDSLAYIADRRNGTFAETTTRTGQAVGVSFWLADPPAVSHLCIHCPGMKTTDLLHEPAVVCAGKDVAVFRIAYTYGARPRETRQDRGAADLDYFVYRAHAGKPSLDLLPNPKPLFFARCELGFLQPGGGEDFLMAAVRPRRAQLQYDLHVFSSKTNAWATRLVMLQPPSPRYETEFLVHETNKVIALDGGTLGWVDLRRGVMLCDVLAGDPVLRYIQFPEPMAGNAHQFLLDMPARPLRDVVYANGFIRLVEIEERRRLIVPAKPSDNDPSNGAITSDPGTEVKNTTRIRTSLPYIRDGWTAVTYCTKPSLDRWSKVCTACVSESSILSALRHSHPESSPSEAMEIAGPLWSVDAEDVFYLMGKADLKDKNALAIAKLQLIPKSKKGMALGRTQTNTTTLSVA
ncbi:hypothetical protein ACP70R_047373 [Stipagrostis hirtigluma subsp. patula]